jgi:O-antigen/teichoic acid export membrane protein
MSGTGPVAAAVATAEPPVRRERLGHRLLKGAAVETASFGIAQVVRLAANLVLTRLLFPQAFGLMAMLQLVLYGLIMLTDVGLGPAVIRSPRGDDEAFLDTTWTIQAGRGLFLWVLAALLAWPVSLVFREPSLLWLVPAGSSAVFLQGLSSTRIFTMRRRLRLVPIAILDLGSQVVGAVLMVGLAWAGLGVWSLVLGQIVGAAARAAGSYLFPGEHRPRIRIDESSRREIVHFGRWIYFSSVMTFLAGRGDSAVLGRLLGAASLGLYNIALTLAEAPEMLANRVITAVLFPTFARIHNEQPGALQRAYYRVRLAFDAAVHVSLGGLIAIGPWLVDLMYDSRYRGAGIMLQILALRASIGMLAAPCENALVAQGLTQYGFRLNLVVAIGTFVGMPLGYALGGQVGLLWGTTAARLPALAVLWPAARERGILRLEREILVVPFLAAGYGLGRVLLWILPAVQKGAA